MSKIEQTLDSLQPYVIGIRFVKTIPVVDVVMNEGWTFPEDINIIRARGDDETINYRMIYSEVEGVGLDKLLEYVDKTIKVNKEREKKHELLKDKVNLLKELFKKNSLEKLQRLTFGFGEEDFLTNIDDIDTIINEPTQQQITETFVEETISEPLRNQEVQTFLDENGKPIEMSDEEKELALEEERAQINLKILESRKQTQAKPSKKVELPPKRMPALVNSGGYGDCNCGENAACDKCIDSKDY